MSHEEQSFANELRRFKIQEKHGYKDKAGQVIIPPQFIQSWEFSEGLAGVKIGLKWGYINARGEVVIPPQFDRAESFSNGLARICIGRKYSYIDKTGEVVSSPPDYDGNDFKAEVPISSVTIKIRRHESRLTKKLQLYGKKSCELHLIFNNFDDKLTDTFPKKELEEKSEDSNQNSAARRRRRRNSQISDSEF